MKLCKNKSELKKYGDLMPGEVFQKNGSNEFLMKLGCILPSLPGSTAPVRRSVNLESGMLCSPRDDEIVYFFPNAELNIVL